MMHQEKSAALCSKIQLADDPNDAERQLS